MRTLAGPGARVHFTNLSKTSVESLTSVFERDSNSGALATASCHTQGVLEFIRTQGSALGRVCLLDPKAEAPLAPEDGDGRFDWFLFGVRIPSSQKRSARSHLGLGRVY